jgi:hypothetical protein
MMAAGITDVEQYFAQLYAIPNIEDEPATGGRQMNGHFASRSLDADGHWKNLKEMKNSAADSSPTASQMVRAVGLAQASKMYRNNPSLAGENNFSNQGNEAGLKSGIPNRSEAPLLDDEKNGQAEQAKQQQNDK